MGKILQILHLEDELDYCDVVRGLLLREGIEAEVHPATTREEFLQSIGAGGYDLILADYLLPGYDGLQALLAAREVCPEVPFLLLSGTIGEQAAVASLKAGATDYVMKIWPEALGPAIRRAMHETQEKQARLRLETQLVRQENYFRALTENCLDILTLMDASGGFLYNSPSVKRVLGYQPEELLDQNAFTLLHPDDLPQVLQGFHHGLENPGQTVTVSFRVRHKNGSWHYLEAVGQNRIGDPEIGAVVVNSRDVDERKRGELRDAALSELGHALSSATSPGDAAQMILQAADKLFSWDVFTLDLYDTATDRVRSILNMDTDREGRRFEVTADIPIRPPSKMARRVIEHGAELILRPDPPVISDDVVPIGDTSRASASLALAPIRDRTEVIGVLAIQSYTLQAYTAKDLAVLQMLADHCGGALERMRAESDLRESQQGFRYLFESSPDAIFVEDLDGTVLDANSAACRLHGLTKDVLVGLNVQDLVPPEARDLLLRDFEKVARGEADQLESASLTSNGQAVPVELRCSRIEHEGRVALLLHVRDVTDRRRAEEALRSSEMLFHSVWENSVDGMRLTDAEGTVVAVNDAYCRLVGLSRQELERWPLTVCYQNPEESEGRLEDYRKRFAARSIEKRVELKLTLHDGRKVVFENTNSFVELRGNQPLLLGVYRDLTGQKQLEEQFRQAQKMEAVGQLAGGVAHDFNNILTVVQGHASLLEAGRQVSEPASRSARQIIHAAERAAGLTRQLLAFCRRQVIQPKRLDLNEVVANITKMLGRLLGETIALKLQYAPQPALVLADSSMVEQVLLNLTINARDAMPEGGLLSIGISTAEFTSDKSGRRDGRFVCLKVSDTGSGIAPENLGRIFEPFFTTKGVGKGTGLGLATVYGIVKQHEGWVEVESELGRGATFRIFLPLLSGPPGSVEEDSDSKRVRGGTETILVVEDEGSVRELVCLLLESYGYHVLKAESGPQALDAWRSSRDRIDLVLTDLVMPDRMTGRELAEKLWNDRPDLKVIFTSGYSADVVGKDYVLGHSLNYLQKPYHPHKLATMVRDCLDAVN